MLWETSLEAEQESGHYQVEPSPSLANPTGLVQPAGRKYEPALPLRLLAAGDKAAGVKTLSGASFPLPESL